MSCHTISNQSCGFQWIWTRSRSNYKKKPDPDLSIWISGSGFGQDSRIRHMLPYRFHSTCAHLFMSYQLKSVLHMLVSISWPTWHSCPASACPCPPRSTKSPEISISVVDPPDRVGDQDIIVGSESRHCGRIRIRNFLEV